MASTEENMSKAQMSGKILATISAADAAPDPPVEKRRYRQDEELEGQVFFRARSVEKRGLLDIDLNVAPPEDDGSESPLAENGGDGQKIQTATAFAVSAEKVCFVTERGSIFNETAPVREVVFNGNGENRDDHLWKGGIIGGGEGGGEEEEDFMENIITVADSEKEQVKKEMGKNMRWNALLEAAEYAFRDYEEIVRNKEEKAQNRKRRPSREDGIGGELHKSTVRKKMNGRSSAERWIETLEPVVVRSTRGRAVAMPNKYRDSFLHAAAVAEARFSRHNTTRKSR